MRRMNILLVLLLILSGSFLFAETVVADKTGDNLRHAWKLNNQAYADFKSHTSEDGKSTNISVEELNADISLLNDAIAYAENGNEADGDFKSPTENRAACLHKIHKNLKYAKARLVELGD